jgi:hypothetical protein
MKNKICFLLIFGSMVSACDDFYQPSKSSLEESVVFSTIDLAESAVNSISHTFGEGNSYMGRWLSYYGANTDLEWGRYSHMETNSATPLFVYVPTATNSLMNTWNNTWAKSYEGIERANLCIQGLRNTGKALPRTDFGQLLAESLTLRAVLYADLVKTHGDVPARFQPISTETLYVPKADRDVIYKQLIADLGEASELAFWPNEHKMTSTVGRINKTFIKGLRARLCLNAAGYSKRPDTDQPRLSNDPELSKEKMYTIARQDLLDVYTNPKSGKMEASFERVFRKLCEEDMSAGGESLWQIPFSSSRGRMAYTFAVRHQSVDQYTAMPQGGSIGPLPNLFYDYDVNDTRRDVTCVPYQWSNSNPAYQTFATTRVNTWSFGKYRFEWMKRKVLSTISDGLQKQYMRYAEIILMLAEVENELNGPAAAAPYLKEIRKRAFSSSVWQEKVEDYVNALDSKEKMFNAIVDEYAFEFAGEMLRKETLIRWNLLKVKMDEAKARMYELRDQTGRYADVSNRLYYKLENDKETLKIYGLNRGETEDKSSEYPNNVLWISTSLLNDAKIESIYNSSIDPNQYQFWPIWQYFIDNSNGKLVNDYGY